MRATEHPNSRADSTGKSDSSACVGIDRDELWKGFRRSERVRLEMSVDVYIIENEESIFERAITLNVSAHGGLLVLNTPVKLGQQIRLINRQADKEVECHVNRIIMRHPGGGIQVGVAFVEMSPDFWDIPSPPADWDPAWVPPAERKRPEVPSWELQEPVAEVLFRESIQEVIREQKESIGVIPAAAKSNGTRISKPLILLAVSAVFFTLWTVEARRTSVAGLAVSESYSPVGISPEDARIIPGVERFRIATADDFSTDAVSWLRGLGRQISGKIPGVYFGSFESNAYVLVGKANERRVVILAGGEVHYNAEYPVIAIATRVPKDSIQRINWADPTPPEPDGDGLLIVRAADAPASGVVVFLRGNQVVSANPSDYRQVYSGRNP